MIDIYVLMDGNDNVRYVGQSVDAKKRREWHIQAAKRGEPGRVYNWIRWCIKNNHFIGKCVVDRVPVSEANDSEITWIAIFRAAGCDLTNCTDGGGGTRGAKHSAQTKAKIGAAHRGKTHSAETRAKLSATRIGVPLSNQRRSNMKIARNKCNWSISDNGRKILSEKMKGNKLGQRKHSKEQNEHMRNVLSGSGTTLASFSDSEVMIIRAFASKGVRQSEIADLFNTTRATICRIVNCTTYRNQPQVLPVT